MVIVQIDNSAGFKMDDYQKELKKCGFQNAVNMDGASSAFMHVFSTGKTYKPVSSLMVDKWKFKNGFNAVFYVIKKT